MSASTTADLQELLRHAGWVRALVRELVKDPDRRADVEQETWLAALTRRPSRLDDVRGWLRAVVLNALRQGARGEARRERRERGSARGEALPPTDELVAQAHLQRRVVRAVLELEEPERSTLLLCYFRGMSCAEIARGAGLPASTVRNRLQRGLARLRERFDRELGGPDERRRVFLAWLALPHAGAVPRLAVRLAQRTAIAGLLLVLGAVAVLRWRAAGATAAPEIDARTSSASAHATHVSPAPALAAGREPVVATVATRLGDGLAGTVVDELGAPVEGALVTVASPTRFETEPVAIGVATHTDATGAFALPRELAPRTGLVLFAEKAGHVPARAELLHDSTRIVLRTAATFTGLVVDAESDAPLAGVRITFHEHDWSDGAMRETRTDAAGRFSVARVPSGVLSFALARPGDAFQARRLFVPRDGAHDVRIALARGASIQGRVVDGDTGAGLADARIVVDFADVVRSAGDGSFALAGVEPAERHDVEVRLAGHCSVVLALEDGAPLDEPLVLPIWRECAVEGVVRDGAGAAQPFAEVSLHDDRALAGPALPPGVRVGSLLWQAHSTLADEHGRFRIDRLAPWRSFEIVARVRGQRAFGRVELAGPASRAVADVTLPAASARLTGLVRVNGEPVRARIRWNAPRSGGDALVDERGGFLVEVEPGAVAFYVDVAERGLELTELLTLVAGASRHDFALEAAQSSVGGFVRRSDGTPVADQEVLAFCPGYDGPGGRARTDDNGAFRVWTTATRGEDLTLRTRTGPLTVSRFPVPAGSEGVELVLPDTGHVELRVLAPAGALEPTELEVAWSDVSSSANELPRRALVPLGDGRWLVEVPAGRIDLEVRAPRSTWAAVRIAGVRIEPHAQPAIELVAFAAPFAANER